MPGYSVLITGSSRGIGLGLVREFLKRSDVAHVFATARNPDASTDLKELNDPRVHLIVLDVFRDDTIGAARDTVASVVGDAGLNLLINNAGALVNYWPDEHPNRKAALESLEANTVSPLLICQTFLPLLKKAASHAVDRPIGIKRAAIINITSDSGSIQLNNGSGFDTPSFRDRSLLVYCVSKAGLNMVTKCLSVDWKPFDILVVGIHPGWVRTLMGDLGSNEAVLSVEQSVEAIVKTAERLEATHSGAFLDQDGQSLPF